MQNCHFEPNRKNRTEPRFCIVPNRTERYAYRLTPSKCIGLRTQRLCYVTLFLAPNRGFKAPSGGGLIDWVLSVRLSVTCSTSKPTEPIALIYCTGLSHGVHSVHVKFCAYRIKNGEMAAILVL